MVRPGEPEYVKSEEDVASAGALVPRTIPADVAYVQISISASMRACLPFLDVTFTEWLWNCPCL